ncbi:unnamed protein product, partial [Brassica rapa subsp. trilocularis]
GGPTQVTLVGDNYAYVCERSLYIIQGRRLYEHQGIQAVFQEVWFTVIRVSERQYNSLLVRCRVAVMQTDGFDYLKRSCPSLLTELLEYVARLSEHSVIALGHRKEVLADGCDDANGRRVKQRLH